MIMLTLLSGFAGSPAHAADEIGLSWDGQRWADDLTGSLFDESVRWVPGDERTNHFYIRNNANSGAVLTIAVESKDSDHLLRNDDIDLTARVGHNDWVSLDHVGKTFRLSRGSLRSRESDRVQVRAAFDPASANGSQRDKLKLDFRVTLTDASSTDDGNPGDKKDDNDDKGLLPDTGSPVVGWLILLAGVMLGVGLALLRRTRKAEGSVDV